MNLRRKCLKKQAFLLKLWRNLLINTQKELIRLFKLICKGEYDNSVMFSETVGDLRENILKLGNKNASYKSKIKHQKNLIKKIKSSKVGKLQKLYVN